MLENLKAYSAMIRGKRSELGLTTAILAHRAGVSTKTLALIENEKWPKSGELSCHQKRGQAKTMANLAVILEFDVKEWSNRLNLSVKKFHTTRTILGKPEIQYLLEIVEITGPLTLSTMIDLLNQRSTKSAPD